MKKKPIELAIKEIKALESAMNTGLYKPLIQSCINQLESLLFYEEQYLRDVAEKAWDAGQAHLGSMFLQSLKMKHPNKEDFLNKKYPLVSIDSLSPEIENLYNKSFENEDLDN